MNASPSTSSPQSPSPSSSSSPYDAWLALIPQFFAQLGVPVTNGAQSSPVDAANLPYPLDQIARAATMTLSSLQNLQQTVQPMLQMAAGPGLLGQWAAAMAPSAAVSNGASGATLPMPIAPPSLQLSLAEFASTLFGVKLDPAVAQTWTTGFDRTFGALTDAIGLAPARRLQAALQGAAAIGVADLEARSAYMSQVQGAFVQGFERLLEKLVETSTSGHRIEGVLPLMKLWATCTEEALHAVMQSEAGLAATAALSRASVSRRKKLQEVAAIVAEALDMVTRQELDEAFREIQELKREVRKLRAPVITRSGRTESTIRARSTQRRVGS